MDEREIGVLLRRSGESIEVDPPPVEAITGRGRRRRRAVRGARVVGVGALLSVLAGAALVLLPGGGDDTPPAAGQGCVSSVVPRVLPTWARTGFTDPEPVMPYVLGERGSIVAILWSDRLSSPPAPKVSNKILWVERSPGPGFPALVIRAHREGTGTVVTRSVQGGPGPSIIDLPAPGCWRLDLSWGDQTDVLHLRYR